MSRRQAFHTHTKITRKDDVIYLHRNAKWNHCSPTIWLKWKSLAIPGVGKDVASRTFTNGRVYINRATLKTAWHCLLIFTLRLSNYTHTHTHIYMCIYISIWVSQVALVVKNPPANAGDAKDMDSSPGLVRSPREGYVNPLKYSCLENPTDRGAWWATVHGVTKSRTQRKWLSMHAHTHTHIYVCMYVCMYIHKHTHTHTK